MHPAPPAASCGAASLWAQDEENEGLDPTARWVRQIPEQLTFTPRNSHEVPVHPLPHQSAWTKVPGDSQCVFFTDTACPEAQAATPCVAEVCVLAGACSAQHLRKQAALSLRGINFGLGQGCHDQKEES